MTNTNSRYTTLKWLIITAALTMMPLYAIQGAMGAGLKPDDIPAWVWFLEHTMWAARSVVEGFVFGYVYSTQTTTEQQAKHLFYFKVALLGIIAITVGALFFATVSDMSIAEALPAWWLRALWSLGLALYLPLMIGAAGYAYKVQPGEVVEQQADPAEIAELQQYAEALERQFNEAETLLDEGRTDHRKLQQAHDALTKHAAELEAQAQAVPALKLLTASEIARILAEREDRPPASVVARELGVHPSTVSKAYKNGSGK